MRRRFRKRGGKGYRRAGDPLGRVLDRYGVRRELREHRLLSHWVTIVGDRVAAHTYPDGLDQGVLWVRVKSSAWLHELSFLKEEIIARANQEIGRPAVREVKLHLGSRRASADDPLAPTLRIRRPPPLERPLPQPARGETLAAIERETSTVEDEELRAAILEARRKLCL